MAYRLVLSRVAKNALAAGLASSADARSSGTVALLCDSYAPSHRPSALALSTSLRPAGFILPSSMSAVALVRLTLDHLLLGRRGVKRCRKYWSSNAPFCPSIQP